MSSDAIALAAANLARISAMRSALEALSAACIRAAVAPTPGTVRLLSGASGSELADARVIVSPRDLARARDALVRAGWREEPRAGGDVERRVFARPRGEPVVLVTTIAGDRFARRLSLDEALDRATDTPAAGVTLRAFTAADRLTALCATGAEQSWPREYLDAAAAHRTMCSARTTGGGAHRLILRQWQSPGDVVMLTAAVRELHAFYPGRFLTDVRTHCRDLWTHNPYITPIDENDPDAEVIDCEYPLIHQSNQRPVHFIYGFIEFLNARLGLRMSPSVFAGDIHLSRDERARPSPVHEIAGEPVPYWIVAAGGKYDFTTKWWSAERYQAIVDRFRGRLLFVQVGEAGHHHPALDGALDLRGQTPLRDLIRLVHHADGVLTPVSLLMHLAAAIEPRPGSAAPRPCIVVAGGREPVHWEAYPGHQFLHTIGALPCCATGGCWRSRTLPIQDGDEKDEAEKLCVDVVDGLPRCMDLISAADVIDRVELYLNRAARPLTRRQGHLVQRVLPTRSGAADIGTNAPLWCRACPPPDPRPDARVTVCVLTYGDHLDLARRCLESIERYTSRDRYQLIVGANAVSPAVREYLYTLRLSGRIDRLHESPTNINKNPMMRRMFAGIATDFVWWFDDDSHVTDATALDRRLALADAAPPSAAIWGHKHFFSRVTDWAGASDVAAFIRSAPWYRGRPLPGEPGDRDPRWWFPTGGSWFARTAALREIDWPDPRLVMASEDVFLGEAIGQQGWEIVDVGSCGVAISDAPRRGTGSDRATMERQIAAIG